MKHFKKFNNINNYNNYKNSNNFIEPNISKIENNDFQYNEVSYSKRYLTFVLHQPGTISFTAVVQNKNMYYSLDDGKTWIELLSGVSSDILPNNKKILIKGNYNSSSNSGIGTFSSSVNFDVSGNVMSLINEDNFFNTENVSNHHFDSLFNGSLVYSARKLVCPIKSKLSICTRMFKSCVNLIEAPEILPATILEGYCYAYMFEGCTKLRILPKLPALSLADNCYRCMFYNCTSLVNPPLYMLPATTLADHCYSDMFRGCTLLETAPVLPATTLVSNCYTGMFRDATNLKHVVVNYQNEPNTLYTQYFINTNDVVIEKLSDTTWNYEDYTSAEGFIYNTANKCGSIVVQKRTLPTGYKQVQYIESSATGGQYVDLNLQMWTQIPLSYSIECGIFVNSDNNGMGYDNNEQATFISCTNEQNSNYPGFTIRKDKNEIQQNRNPKATLGYIGTNVRLNISKGNGSQMDFTPERTTHDKSIYLFCDHNSSWQPFRFSNAKIYYLKIRSNSDNYVRDLVPAVNSNNIAGLYDVVNDVFYTSSGASQLIAGPELTPLTKPNNI